MEPRELLRTLVREYGQRRSEPLEAGAATHRATGENPVCGDRVEIELVLTGDVIQAAAYRVRACALCVASSAILAEQVRGRDRVAAVALAAQVDDLLSGRTSSSEPPLALFTELRALPARRSCAALPWQVLAGLVR